MNYEKVIGIVAGAGPFAGLDLVAKILDQTLAARDQDHLTVVSLFQSNQILDRTEYLLGRVAVNPAYAIAGQLRQLEQAGAQVAGIPCNTAHAPPIFDVVVAELQSAGSRIQVLHMIQEVARHLRQGYPGLKRLGVLATMGTFQARIYPNALEPEGFTILTTSAAMQAEVIHAAVYDPTYGIKARGRATAQARENLLAGVRTLAEAGAEAVILGCTEMPLAITGPAVDGLPMIDSTLILARALVREANPGKLKPMTF